MGSRVDIAVISPEDVSIAMSARMVILGILAGFVCGSIIYGVLLTGVSQPSLMALNGSSKPPGTGPVRFSGYQLLVNNQPFFMRGVGYSPVPIGRGSLYDYYSGPGIYSRDFHILRTMGCNTIRTWTEVTNRDFLDAAYNEGEHPIYVIMGFRVDPTVDLSSSVIREYYINEFKEYVGAYKDHPAVLMWSIGNEVNLLMSGGEVRENIRVWYTLLNEMARAAYEVEGSNYHPVTTSNGEIASIGDESRFSDDASLDYLDAWGIAVYQGGTDFVGTFAAYPSKSSKPVWISEYGVDAWNQATNQEDEDTQAFYDGALWDSIEAHSSLTFGGCVMAYCDEWYKHGNPSSHDLGGYEFLSSPDGFLNEEWWGVMKIMDNGDYPDILVPRKVYDTLQEKWGGLPSPPTLSFGRVIVENRNGELTFEFTVSYADLNNDSPAWVKVYIDEEPHSMTEANPQDERYADGKIYSFSTSLPSGNHVYYFEASDGSHTVTSNGGETSGVGGSGPSALLLISVSAAVVLVMCILWHFNILQKIVFKK